MQTAPILLATTLAFSSSALAQITYVDADFSTNTTNADGTPAVPGVGTGNDDLWQVRPFANGTTIISSNDSAATGSEDCPMLRTTITGLIPTLPYVVYGYQWSTNNDTAQWRIRMDVDTTQPAGPLTLWYTKGTSNLPMSTALPTNAYTGASGASTPRLDLQFDPVTNLEIEGHFTAATPAMLFEGNRTLYEIPLGVFAADFNGEIHVYVDDDPQSGNFYRNWYDGVGYEMVPLQLGVPCGTSGMAIAFAGEPTFLRDFTIELTGATPSATALLTFGFPATTWNGLPLPLDLGLFGFAGCYLNVNSTFNMFGTTDASGYAAHTWNFPVLANPLNLDWQWGVLEPTGGASMSMGQQTVIHR